jgi:flagellar M-ring protein FliF
MEPRTRYALEKKPGMSASPDTMSSRLPAWTRIPPQQLLALLLVVATGIALLAGGWMWSTTPEYKVLYANLSDRDGGAVISSLQQMNVPYKFAEGGGALLVPSEHVHDVRLRLASQGLPKGGISGFEITDNPRFGQSQFAEQLTYQRGLEGELSRTIQAIQSVQSARVHLALSRGSAFLREQAKPSASVLVHLHPGRTLDATHVAAIVHLVSNSVPDLSTKSVTVVDQNGALLSGEGSAAAGGAETKQLKYRQETEQGYVKRIESILGPLLGATNVRAQVSAEIDFSEVEQAEEIYKPNSKPEEAAIRAQQTTELGKAVTSQGSGVPGALTNQPPAQATAPITAPAGAEQAAAATAGGSANQRRDSAVSYEVDKSIRHTKIAQGRTKRLSVAVVVNDRKLTDASGKTTSKPLSDAEKAQITELVKGVMGYDEKRGDTVSVINSAFTMVPAEKIAEVPVWKDPSTLGAAKDIGRYLLIGAFILFLVFKVLKPMARNLSRPPELAPSGELALLPSPDGSTAPPPHADRYESSVHAARQIAKQDPKVVANVVKNWVGND